MLLVVDRKETTLRYQNQTIRMEREGKATRTIPIRQLEQVVVYGNPLVESSVWRALADAGVPATLLPGRGQSGHAVLGAGLAVRLPFRRMQHRFASDPALSIELARYFVRQKLLGYLLPLRTLNALYPVDLKANNAFSLSLVETTNKLSAASDVSSLMGLEGQLAQAWFVLLAKSLPFKWKFAGRNRRPPLDPVNAVLSLGYTLMGAEVRQAVISQGLDPALGFLHQDYPGRESLVLDVTEIFRAGVDDFMLRWLHDAELDEGSFYFRDDTGCRLSKVARPLFYKAWGASRYRWPRPFESGGEYDLVDEDDADIPMEVTEPEWPVAWLPEILNGQVMQLREYMKRLDPESKEVEHEVIAAGDGAFGVESGLEDDED
uniref:CRISPR-associated endonuclease Cas1 n=1 Tax=uncultured Thiotrichaceae bacterium TaxID=298394 RepID=A0A6S6UFS2_9GAMM|nr:MAG: CRISPR-associated protein Cas1 [uncultured Thiotrichaceae bacterium]